MTSSRETLELIHRYFRAIESKNEEEVRACLADDVVQHEYPNRLVAHGATRTLVDILHGLGVGAQTLRAERYDIVDVLVDRDRAACRVFWTGVLAIAVPTLARSAGDEIKAQLAIFLKIAAGRIVEQHNYDCFIV